MICSGILESANILSTFPSNIAIFDMPNTVRKTVYFEKPGPQNTEETLKLAKQLAQALGIKNIVVASTTGETGAKASKILKGYNVIVVTHVTGFAQPTSSN